MTFDKPQPPDVWRANIAFARVALSPNVTTEAHNVARLISE
jgi:hypothetical protein